MMALLRYTTYERKLDRSVMLKPRFVASFEVGSARMSALARQSLGFTWLATGEHLRFFCEGEVADKLQILFKLIDLASRDREALLA